MSEFKRDPGLAAERTQLAWSRSALSLFACGAAAFKGIPDVTNGHPVAGGVLLALGGIVWLAGVPLARQRARESHTGTRRVVGFHELAPVAYGSALVGLAALVLAAFFPN